MGQKINPKSLRLPLTKDWQSHWFSPKKQYTSRLIQDFKIRRLIKQKLGEVAGLDRIIIKRQADEITADLYSSRPGIIIGRQGKGIQDLKEWLINQLTEKSGGRAKINLQIIEIKIPDLQAELVAQNIGYQISKRVYYKRAVKQAITKMMQAGAKGVKVQVSGRLGGSDIARTEKFGQGSIPSTTLRVKIDFAVHHAQTTYGTIGIKVWIHK